MRLAAAGILFAAGLPFVLWYSVIVQIASGFRLEVEYLATGWTPWVLMGVGVVCLLPSVVAAATDPESRLYPRAWKAYLSWGICLYLLGFAVAAQVAQITEGLAR